MSVFIPLVRIFMPEEYPSRDLQYVLNRYKLKSGMRALDLGCGEGTDSLLLLEKGFNVTAVDKKTPKDKQLLFHSQFTFHKSLIEDFEFDKYDLVNAQWVLPFIDESDFEEVVMKIKTSLNKGGFFIGQFFGLEDEWKKSRKDVVFISNQRSLKLLSGLEIVKFAEVKLKGFTYNKSPKYWHYFEFIVRKL